jgi:hypothetical protein
MAAYTAIDDPEEYFNIKLYTGTGSGATITGVGFQPSMFILKQRNSNQGMLLWDVIRGGNYYLNTNTSGAQNNDISTFTAASDGYSLGTDTAYNGDASTYVGWNWLAGTAVSSASTGGSGTAKTYSGTVNTDAGFSIITYVGNGTDNHQVPHHLGAVPKMFIMKNISRASRSWNVYHHTQTASNGILLNSTDASGNDGSMLNNVEPTSVYVNLGDSSETNQNDDNHIMYAFAEKQGYSKFGSYTGNGNADGTFVYTGFRPAFLMIKNASTGSTNWTICDSKRDGFNDNNHRLFANVNDAESTSNPWEMYSNGFKMTTTGSYVNSSGDTFIYMAFAESPFVNSNGVPNNAR